VGLKRIIGGYQDQEVLTIPPRPIKMQSLRRLPFWREQVARDLYLNLKWQTLRRKDEEINLMRAFVGHAASLRSRKTSD